jgi:hypothetical protein
MHDWIGIYRPCKKTSHNLIILFFNKNILIWFF